MREQVMPHADSLIVYEEVMESTPEDATDEAQPFSGNEFSDSNRTDSPGRLVET